MKSFIVPIIFLLLCIQPICASGGQEPVLVWKDANTNRILFTSNDILSFDWEKQVFLLNSDAILDFIAWTLPHKYQYRTISIEDDKGIICQAKWVSQLSSMSFIGQIYEPLSPNPYFSIKEGYPGKNIILNTKDDATIKRFHTGLEKANVLKTIDLTKPITKIKLKSSGWKHCGDLAVRVEICENTFLIGKKARIHIYFEGGQKTLSDTDKIVIEASTSWKGKSFSYTHHEEIPKEKAYEGVYILKFNPILPKNNVKLSIKLNSTNNQYVVTKQIDFDE